MPFLPVPWAVEGGALNVAEGARILAYAAANGNDGILGLADLRVTQTTTASARVAVSTGACIIPCKAPGYDYQSYIASRPVADDFLDVPANGGAGTVYHMVTARVFNPHLSTDSSPMPADVAVGPYVKLFLNTNISGSALASPAAARAWLRGYNLSSIPLAGITLPAGAGAVLNSHLTDLRTVANPRTQRTLLTYSPTVTRNVPDTWADWLNPNLFTFDVPEWATLLRASLTMFGGRMDRQSSGTDGQSAGDLRFRLGSTLGAVTKYDLTAPASGGTTTRFSLGVADTIPVASTLRGTQQVLTVQGDKTSGNQNLYVDPSTTITLDVEFAESAA